MARKTKAEAEATRESILDAAEHVFYEQGVARTSLEQIACAASVTRGAIYWHFRNKADLFEAMLSRVSVPLTARLDALQGEGSDLADLREVCIYSLRQLASSGHHFRVFTILFLRTESDIGLAVQDRLARHSVLQLTRFFGQPSIVTRLHAGLSPELAANALHSYFVGIYYEWLRDPQSFDLDQRAPALVDVILRGVCH